MKRGRELRLHLGARVPDQNLLAVQQQHLIAGAVCLQPLDQRRDAHALRPKPLVVKLHQRFLLDEQIPPPRARLELLYRAHQCEVFPQKSGGLHHVAGDQRIADKNLSGSLGVNVAKVHSPPIADRQAIQRDPLLGHDTTAPPLPGGLIVMSLEHTGVHTQQPVGLNGAALTRIHLRGLDDLARYQPGWRLFVLARAREHDDLAVTGGVELFALIALCDITQEPGEKRLMHRLVGLLLRELGRHAKTELPAGHDQLTVYLAPLSHTHIGEVLALAELAQLVLTQRLPLRLVVAPQREPRQKIRARMLKARVRLIGLGLFVGGSLAGILNRHGRDNHQHLGQTT